MGKSSGFRHKKQVKIEITLRIKQEQLLSWCTTQLRLAFLKTKNPSKISKDFSKKTIIKLIESNVEVSGNAIRAKRIACIASNSHIQLLNKRTSRK